MSAIFFLIAASFPIQISIIYRIELFDILGILSKLTFINISTMVMLFAASILTMQINKRIFYALPILNFFIFFNNFIVSEYGSTYSSTQTLSASLIFLVSTLGFYQKDIYKVFHDLRYRYWLSSKRFNKEIIVLVEYEDQNIWSKTYDISKTGMFIVDENLEHLYKIPGNSTIKIKLFIGTDKYIPLEAVIIRKSFSRGKYPAGIGIQFTEATTKRYQYDLELAKATV